MRGNFTAVIARNGLVVLDAHVFSQCELRWALRRASTELFKQFMDNDSFKSWMIDTVFSLAYEPAATP